MKNTDIAEYNPEFQQIMDSFMEHEIGEQNTLLTLREKHFIALVSLAVQNSEIMLEKQIDLALKAGITPLELLEALYQCAPYVGFPRTVEAVGIADEMLKARGIRLPLPEQGTVSEETRFAKGVDAQSAIFGEARRKAAEHGPDGMNRTAYYLVSNCFGDYYTRGGLDLKTRELLTLSILVNLGTESQIRSHMNGNKNMGRSRAFMEEVLWQCLPYMGYPRLLNAMRGLEEAMVIP